MSRRMEKSSNKYVYIIIISILIGVIIFLLINKNSESSKNNSKANTPATTTETSNPTSNPLASTTSTPSHNSTPLPPSTQTTPYAGSTALPTSSSEKTTIEKPDAYVTWAKWKVESDGNGKLYMLVYGTDEVKDTVWTYKSDLSTTSNFEFLGENNQKLYINELGKIVTINKQNGSVVWENSDYNGKNSHYKFDSTGCIYITSSTTPALIVIDSTGKTIRTVEKIDNYDSSKISELAITDTTLTITYSDNKKLDLKISDIKDSSKNLF